MQTTLLVITGASRGIGRAVGNAFVKLIGDKSITAILIARTHSELVETQRQMQSAGDVDSVIYEMDLSNLDELDDNIDTILGAARPFSKYNRVVFVNNAGSIGHLGPAVDHEDSAKAFQQYMDFNITSSLWFTTRFARELQPFASDMECTLINISSLCAISPVPTMASYCTGKAARDMFHACLAKELPSMKILNWAPGAVQTEMTDCIRASDNVETNVAKWYKEAHQKGEFLSPLATSEKLVKLTLSGNFESGAHVDYWDIGDDAKKEVENISANTNTTGTK
jgi:sepiapterin reductase